MSESNLIGDVVHRHMLPTRSNIEQCRKYETKVIIRRNVCCDIYLGLSLPLNCSRGKKKKMLKKKKTTLGILSKSSRVFLDFEWNHCF